MTPPIVLTRPETVCHKCESSTGQNPDVRIGTLTVHCIRPPFPHHIGGKFHILLAHLRQLHLTYHLLRSSASNYDVYFVDQLSTCIPALRLLAHKRVVFYCHFPDKLLANGEFVEGNMTKRGGLLKRAYRVPMDWLEDITIREPPCPRFVCHRTEGIQGTRMSSLPIQASLPGYSRPTSPVSHRNHVSCIQASISVRTSGRMVMRMKTSLRFHRACSFSCTLSVSYTVFRDRPTVLSFNRFEKKKNVALAIDAFALFKQQLTTVETQNSLRNPRLVVGGGYDPRVEENMMTLVSLVDRAKAASLTYTIITPPSSKTTIPPFNMTHKNPDVIFLLNFTTSQRAALLSASSTLALLYTPANEHFGIVPVEAMSSGLPVLACNSGGPTESVIDDPPHLRTGWLRAPDAASWAAALLEIAELSPDERSALAGRARARAREHFGMEAMGRKLESALVEAVKMGRVPVPAAMWFSSFFVVALLACFMATVYAS